MFLIGEDGHKFGEIGTDEARAVAEERGYDLVEVSPENKPPVAKLMDYGKYKYEQQKKANEARSRRSSRSRRSRCALPSTITITT